MYQLCWFGEFGDMYADILQTTSMPLPSGLADVKFVRSRSYYTNMWSFEMFGVYLEFWVVE